MEGFSRAASMSGSSIVGCPYEPPPPPPPQCQVSAGAKASAKRKGRCQRGGFRIYVLVASRRGGLWRNMLRPKRRECGETRVLAVLLAKIVVSVVGAPTNTDLHTRLRHWALAEASRAIVQGLLEYEIVRISRLRDTLVLEDTKTPAEVIVRLLDDREGRAAWMNEPGLPSCYQSTGMMAQEWTAKMGPLLPVACAVLDTMLAERIAQGTEKVFHCLALTTMLNRKRLLAEDDAPGSSSSACSWKLLRPQRRPCYASSAGADHAGNIT